MAEAKGCPSRKQSDKQEDSSKKKSILKEQKEILSNHPKTQSSSMKIPWSKRIGDYTALTQAYNLS